MATCIVAVQANDSQDQASNPPFSFTLVVALAAVVVGMVVLALIRASRPPATKR